MNTDLNGKIQGKLNQNRKNRNMKKALLVLSLAAVIFTSTVLANPAFALTEDVSGGVVQGLENGGDSGSGAQAPAQAADEQADAQENEAAPSSDPQKTVAAPSADQGVVNANSVSAVDSAAVTENGTGDSGIAVSGAEADGTKKSADQISAAEGSGTAEQGATLAEAAETVSTEEAAADKTMEKTEQAAQSETDVLSFADDRAQVKIARKDGTGFPSDTTMSGSPLGTDDWNRVLSAVSAKVKAQSDDSTAYSVAGLHTWTLSLQAGDGSAASYDDIRAEAEFQGGLNDAGYATKTSEKEESGTDGTSTTTANYETSWRVYVISGDSIADPVEDHLTDLTDADGTSLSVDENGALQSAAFDGSLPETVVFAQIVRETITTGTEKKKEIPMPAVTFDKEAATDHGTITVHVEADEGTFEQGTTMSVKRVSSQDILDKAIEAAGGRGSAAAVDISFRKADGTETEPAKPIRVKMTAKVLSQADKVHVVHVDDTGNTDVVARKSDGKTIESTSSEAASSDAKNAVSFESDSFSVYAIVYTVDFSYEVNGKVYGFTMQGADTVSLRALIEALHVYEKESEEIDIANEDLPEEVTASEDSPLDKFMAEIENVTFSDTSLLVPAYVEEDATAGEIKTELKLFPTYPLGLTQSEVLELNAKEYKEGDWILISMKQFDTTETLTVFMKNGNEFYITVTDAQDQPEDSEGNVITIANPAGTTIDLFDYWVIRQDIIGRDAWGDLNQNWGGHDDNQGLNGTGNNKGINSSTGDAEHGHALKFSPAWEGTVFNGTKNNWTSLNTNGRDGLNSYTGNGNPFYIEDGKQKYDIVQGTLSDGFPILTENTTIGTNGESLAYLFDPRVSHEGKASYPGVNQLLYVDKDGYYTYDSRDYKADFNSDEKTFNVTKQTDDNTEIRGFWPFGTQNFWLGMHVNTQFSMPANGEVLNPYNEYKPMQFEFSGDDDTWLYVDGVLVGDGGGIHNRTEIDINFKNGTVTLTGKKDANHPGDFESVKYLDDIFKAAGKYPEQGSKEEAKNWEDIPGVEGHKRFKAGTYHSFDMFYLERGGGESNLYIHYNLVSTADFTAHKTFHGRDEDDLLKRDEFQFELIGLDGKYRSVKNQETGAYELIPATGEGAASARAIMPKTAGTGGDGTVASPFYDPDTQTLVNGQSIHSQTYRTGVTEDGNVNFGTAEISQEDMNEADQNNPPVYKYLVREVVPDDAVNASGITWGAATEEERKAGGFVKNYIIYDGTVYYMSGRVTSWTETDATGQEVTRHGIAKTYYTDDTFTTVRENTPFISFVNTYNSPHGNVDFTKIDQNKQVLAGATFQLFRDSECTKPAKVIDEDNRPWTATSDANGRVSFEHVRVGTYYMKETAAPVNHALDETVYKVVIEDETDPTKYSRISILGDPQETNVTEIINTEPGKLSIVKEWLDSSGRPEAGGNKTANVHLYKKLDASSAAQTTKVTVVYHREGVSWDLETETGNAVVVENASSFDILWHLGNDASHQLSNMTVNGILYENAQDTTVDCGNGKVTWTPWNGSSSVLHVADLKGNLYIEFTSNCDWFSTKPYIQNKEQYVPPEIDPTPHLVDTIALNSGNSWTASKTIGGTDANHQGYDLPAVDDKGYRYLYYIVELDDSENEISIGNTATGNYKLIGYSPNNSVGVANQGVLTVHNKADGPKTINIVVRKTDDNAKAEKPNYLGGAVFKLEYRTDDSKEYTGVSNEVVDKLDTDSQFTVPKDGITLTGLVDGQYRLKEVQAPEDYIFTVDYPVTFTVSDGVITGTTGTIEKVVYKPATGTGNAEFIIPNEQGVALPRTGGPGTSHFSAFGGILILAAGVLLLRRKHRI